MSSLHAGARDTTHDANDRICHQGRTPNCGGRRDSLITAETSKLRNFRPDQGIPLSTAISAAALPTNRIVLTDLERRREGGKGTPPDARVAEADPQLEGGFVRVKGAPGMRKSLAELVEANDRRSGASRWRVVASRTARVHRAHRRRGTEGSHPAPSSGESPATACALALRSSRPSPLNRHSLDSWRLRGQDRPFGRLGQSKR